MGTRYTEAKNTLDALTGAFNAATAEESRLLAALAAPADTFDPLAAGLRLLRGEPAQRNDSTGLNRELAQVRERLDPLHINTSSRWSERTSIKLSMP